MSGWRDVAYLVEVSQEQNADGTFREVRSSRAAYVNRLAVGASTWLAARSAGLHADASVRLRNGEYSGQQAVVLGGDEYEVERVMEGADYTDLTLRRRLRGD